MRLFVAVTFVFIANLPYILANQYHLVGHKLLELTNDSQAISWNPAGTMMATANRNSIQIWTISFEKSPIKAELLHTLQGSSTDISLLKWSPNGNKLAAITWGTVSIWDTRHWRLLFSISTPTESLTWSPDSKNIAIASQVIDIWNIEERELEKTLEIPENSHPLGNTWSISKVEWSPNGTKLVTVKPIILVWDLTTSVPNLLSCCEIGTYEMEWSPDSRKLASHYGIYNALTGQELVSFDFENEKGFFSEVSWNSSGSVIAGVFLTDLYFVETITGKIIGIVNNDEVIRDAQWKPNDNLILATIGTKDGYGGTVTLWDISQLSK